MRGRHLKNSYSKMIKIINSPAEKNNFNELANHPLQSWEWGEARKKMGIEVLRLIEGKNCFQLTFHNIPYIKFKIGYLPRSIIPSKEMLIFLRDYGKKNNIIFVKLEPFVPSNGKMKQWSNLVKSPHPLFPDWTQILDLTPSEDELLKKMHHKTRYNIRLAENRGVIVKEMSTNEGFQIFAKLYFETCKRQKYFGHNYPYHKTVWENLKNGISHILIAYYKDIPLAAYELFYFKDALYYVYGGTSEQQRNLMASNLLMWETIRLGKKLGAKKLDMWGSLPPKYNLSDSWAGFTRFKEGFGGKFVKFIGSYDLIINPFAYRLYNFLFNFRSVYLKFMR